MATTIRFYYDATITVALTSVFALAAALIAAVIVGGNAPNVSVAIIAFALTGAILLFRWGRGWLRSAARPAGRSHPDGPSRLSNLERQGSSSRSGGTKAPHPTATWSK